MALSFRNREEKGSERQEKGAFGKAGEKSLFRELAEGLLTAIVVALLLKTFVVQAFRIPSGSMIPTLEVGDQILVSKFSYGIRSPLSDHYWIHFSGPRRGDVVVFRYPKDESKDFIKRVIGLPGDHIEIRQKKVYVDGKPLTEPYVQYLQPFVTDEPTRDVMKEVVVPPGEYFVMGDNRDDSYDSRFWGFVTENKILGKAEIIYWSWNNVSHSVRFSRIGQKIR
ncbi:MULTISPECIES: signal peptidase I [Leptospirillum]|uniref:Signal peptidase I n=2 Tax=Leptospirillum ferriphilum TaxID=178606 RepID=A0A059XUX4_9BACT|nr:MULTISPECIES: signal peptidase I [Leptospirillum]AFS54069.1 signal peptidase I [Leptospirillum ferriphilum ML-04]AIA30875.1 signal peptidase I [Leptospirillum ferriphilum YSK]EAY56821.1 MAG: Signal peptidase I [Leptospirillum rubarum]EIJ76742.1 MAG: Signal peptidase I [Leptospirillum sp. Group II 'C75']